MSRLGRVHLRPCDFVDALRRFLGLAPLYGQPDPTYPLGELVHDVPQAEPLLTALEIRCTRQLGRKEK